MEYEEIKRIIDDIGNSNLTSFEMTCPDGTIISMKKENNGISQNNNQNNLSVLGYENKNLDFNKDSSLNMDLDSTQEYKYITSPMVGTFYLKPAPDKDDFVNVGKHVNKGDTTCIIESMKLMNEIESDISGEVIEILKEDGSPVEYGEKLFKIK